MPKKIRDFKAMLRKAGFRWPSGKGSHSIWEHPLASRSVMVSGQDGHDAPRYLETEVTLRVAEVERAKRS
jgi:predicted RNA binding protein YcfA (HicA-like mRNA interferase family)